MSYVSLDVGTYLASLCLGSIREWRKVRHLDQTFQNRPKNSVASGTLSFVLATCLLLFNLHCNQANPSGPGASLSAQNGIVTPHDLYLAHGDSSSISIQVDRECIFEIAGEGIRYPLQKDTLTSLSLSGLGVGEHTFTCGTYSGTVSVFPLNDTDDET